MDADKIFSIDLKIALLFIKKGVYSFTEFKRVPRAKYNVLHLIFASFERQKLQIYFYKK